MKILDRKIVIAYLPMIDKFGVSKVARGIQKSTATNQGFTQVFLTGKSLSSKATKNETWDERRENYLKRHLKAGRQTPLYNIDGSPSRFHLSLIAWAFSPDTKGLKRYIKSHNLNNNLFNKYLG
tara:strand:+ start:2986 stop:3357 length:372 start_codon:yes stop_codon:yes gene_type:complete